MAARLVQPSADVEYERSFHDLLGELDGEPQSGFGWPTAAQTDEGFAAYVEHLREEDRRARSDPRLVPQTTFWLVEGGEIIGIVRLRHELNENLLRFGGHIGYGIRPSQRRRGYGTLSLKLALEEAAKLGLTRVLLTCNSANYPSRKVIEANGGVLENEILVEIDGQPRPTCRYWIDLAERR